ncbi:MAG TPA: DUF3253 domain-containing protein [Methylomirabilota bacterium]|nr:DUF3253 domain-containing protein [Methylomirabilota bacterium]
MTIDPVRIKAAALREAMMALAAERGAERAVDPMEVAVRVAGHDEKVWRRLMKPIKDEAARLAADRRIVVLRKGRPADPAAIRGLWRFRLRAPDEPDPVFAKPAADPIGDDDD